MTKNFNQFADGGTIKQTDSVVGVRDNTEAKFNFPGDGIQDANGNWILKYQSAGPLSVNYLIFENSTTGQPIVIKGDGSDDNISMLLMSDDDGSIELRTNGSGDISFNALATGNLNITTTGGFVNLNSTTPIKGVLDEDDMASNSAQDVPTQQSTKAYVDASMGAMSNLTYVTKLDETASLPNSEPLAPKATGFMASTTGTGAINTRTILGTTNQINLSAGDGSANPQISLSGTLVFPGTATLGGDLLVNGFRLQGGATPIEIITGAQIVLSSSEVTIDSALEHAGEPGNNITFSAGTQTYNIGSTSIMDVNASGLRLGTVGTRFNEFSDDETFASDSATTGVSERAIKAYVDTAVAGASFPWTEVGASQPMVANNGYIANNVGLVTLTLPSTATIGESFRVVGKGTGLFRIAQNASQTIHIGNQSTTIGVGGYLEATHRYDAIELLCTETDTEFTVSNGPQGNFTVV